LEKAKNDGFNILPDISGLGQGGRVGDGKGNVQNSGKGAGEKGLAAAGRADEENVAFL